ncbi:RICIN domain-containing protein [Pseudobacteriovorax antillogorgiicola]|uniref:Pectate lyase n=1 Tax=Pseudobacteriovorax antillogorgiicola TaxID=1513793 RepID=A0A1Y6BLL2_9BACT|nr:RICIN domain-containing protein [Pseudobacteriovorax antillogorgiicola]TCS54667.1 pectate lyase [Pseudobacteriovorax antillogorgiicola]SMF16746.1 Pectate lyase [Pseudobacteriovorax antillogorgiicola]
MRFNYLIALIFINIAMQACTGGQSKLSVSEDQAQLPGDGPFKLINRLSGLTLTNDDRQETSLLTQEKESHSAGQVFNLKRLGDAYLILDSTARQALTVSPDAAELEGILSWGEISSGVEQMWQIESEAPYFKIRSVVTNELLEVYRKERGEGSLVSTWPEVGSGNQHWRLEPQEQNPRDEPIGFAAMGSGTQGGDGGPTVTVQTGEQLQDELDAAKKLGAPITILIDGTITPENSRGDKISIKDMNSVTVLGVDDRGVFDGIGITIVRSHNIIIRNLKIGLVDTGDKDAISIAGSNDGRTHHIWIDHNELFGSLEVDKDYYDGLLDTKRDAQYITISHNYFHDSWKASLHGYSDSDDQPRRITFHHNRFESLNSRAPLFRFGIGHIFNNYYHDIQGSAINSRMGAQLLIEGNHFEAVSNPIVSFYSKDIGFWDLEGNRFEDISWSKPSGGDMVAGPDGESTTELVVPYDYKLDPVELVKAKVLACAGVNKWHEESCQ